MGATLILGLGGAGCDIAAHLHRELKIRAVAVGTDEGALLRCEILERLLIGSKICRGSAAVEVSRGRRAAQESIDELRALLTGAETLILVAGLGGGTGTGAAPVIARLALEMGVKVLAVVTLPFSFETGRRGKALMGLSELLGAGVELLVYDHNEIMHGEMKNHSLVNVLNKAGDELATKLLARLKESNE